MELQNIQFNVGDIPQISPTDVAEETALQHSNRMKEKVIGRAGSRKQPKQTTRGETVQTMAARGSPADAAKNW